MKTESRQNKGQQTREQLLEVAFAQFTKNGFHGTSMRKVAEEAGLALGGIYNHFASKDEMLKAVIIAYHPLTLIIPELEAAKGESGEALMRDAAHRFYQSIQAKPDLLNLLFIELIECRGQHLSELLMELMPTALKFAGRVTTLPDIAADKPPTLLLRVFVGTLVGFVITETILSRLDLGGLPLGNLDDFLDTIFHGLVRHNL